MRRVIGVAVVLSMLAYMACVGSARAQTPPTVPWDEAELTWAPPAEYAGAGGSIGDPSNVWYIVEAAVSGGPGWGPVAITDQTHYRATDLRPGVWQFRVRAFFKGSGYSPPGPVVSKTITEPVSGPPPVTSIM